MTRRTPIHAILIALAAILAASFAQAQSTFDLDDLDEGQLILNFNATEQVSVEQDTLNVAMQYSAQGRDPRALQDEVNKAMREARDILEDTDNIDWSIQQYHVFNIQPQGPASRRDIDNPAWRAQQGLQMQSENSEALLVVTARLQAAGLTVGNMYYSLSNDRYREIADALLDTALGNLQARADRVAGTLGKGRADLVEVNINDGQNFFAPRMMAAEMRVSANDAMSVPVAEPGETQVSVSVSARALLSP